MKEHEFSVILSTEPDEAMADSLYGIIDDGTITTSQGVPQVHFHREAESLETAIRTAIRDVLSIGVKVLRVEMQPDDMLQAK